MLGIATTSPLPDKQERIPWPGLCSLLHLPGGGSPFSSQTSSAEPRGRQRCVRVSAGRVGQAVATPRPGRLLPQHFDLVDVHAAGSRDPEQGGPSPEDTGAGLGDLSCRSRCARPMAAAHPAVRAPGPRLSALRGAAIRRPRSAPTRVRRRAVSMWWGCRCGCGWSRARRRQRPLETPESSPRYARPRSRSTSARFRSSIYADRECQRCGTHLTTSWNCPTFGGHEELRPVPEVFRDRPFSDTRSSPCPTTPTCAAQRAGRPAC